MTGTSKFKFLLQGLKICTEKFEPCKKKSEDNFVANNKIHRLQHLNFEEIMGQIYVIFIYLCMEATF